MKKDMITALIVSGLTLVFCTSVLAESVEKTVIGEGACAKCMLKEKDVHGHQITITDTTGGNATTYYLTQNDVARELGHQLCSEPKKVTATGTVKMVNGKLQLTPTKIELIQN